MRNLLGWLVILLCSISIIIGFLIIITQKPYPITIYKDKIAVLRIDGIIGYHKESFLKGPISEVDYILKILERIKKDEAVKAVVLRINSCGGSVGAVEEVYKELRKLSSSGKKIVVSIGDICASGAYYIATTADSIVSNAGAIIGSIGAVIIIPTAEQLFQRLGIKFEIIKSSNYKDITSFAKTLSDKERRILQDLVDSAHAQFIKVVETRRKKIPVSEMEKVCDGRIFIAEEALRLGLIDKIGGYNFALEEAKKLAGIKTEPLIVEEKISPFEFIFDFLSSFKNIKLLPTNSPILGYIYL